MAEAKPTTADQIINWQPSTEQRNHGFRVFASRMLKEGVRLEKAGNPEQARLRYQKCRAYCMARGIEYPPFNKEATALQGAVGQEPAEGLPAVPTPAYKAKQSQQQSASGDGRGVQGEPATGGGSGSTNEAAGVEASGQDAPFPHEPASPEPLPAPPVIREVDYSWLGTDGPPPEGCEGSAKALSAPVPSPKPTVPDAPLNIPPEPPPSLRPAPDTVVVSQEALDPTSKLGAMLPVLIAPDMYAKPKIIRKAVVTHFCPNPKLVGIHLPDLKEDASMWKSRRGLRIHETVEVILDDGTPGINALYQEVKKPT